MATESGNTNSEHTPLLSQSSPAEVRKYLEAVRDLEPEDLSSEELAELMAWGLQYAQAS